MRDRFISPERPLRRKESVRFMHTLALGAAFAVTIPVVPLWALELGLPAQCTLGADCFVQQFPDMDPGPDAVDPFCGSATYEGHDGLDLRVLSMKDVARGVPVLAMADGVVLRSRDGEPDRLVVSESDRAGVASRECGNGVVIEHGDGVETQYCHMKQGSLVVQPGDAMRKGQPIGQIGASGLAQFPHVHVSLRRDGVALDPVTGRAIGGGCEGGDATDIAIGHPHADLIGRGETQLLAFGLAGAPIDHAALAVSGPPPVAVRASPALVGWAWMQNLQQGDRISIEVIDPAGSAFATGTTDPMDRSKATYSSFAGKRGSPTAGDYAVTVELLRNGRAIIERTASYRVE